MNTFASPLVRSTCQIELPMIVQASRRPCASIARPCTPEKCEGATIASGARQPVGWAVCADAHRLPNSEQAVKKRATVRFMVALTARAVVGRDAFHDPDNASGALEPAC